MGVIFVEKPSVFFVGGRGTKAGDVNAGGCTKEYWGDLKDPNKTLADVMGTNGEPISDAAAWDGSQTGCTVSDRGDGKARITRAACFGSCEIGHVANVMFADPFEAFSSHYEVIAVDANYVDLDCTEPVSGTCDIKVGGAYDLIQTASDNTTAVLGLTGEDVNILSNKPRTYTGAGDQIDIDTGGGHSGEGTYKRIIAVDSDGVELTKGTRLVIDVNNQACYGIRVAGLIDNIEIKRIKIINVPDPKAGISYAPGGWSFGYILNDCETEDCYIGIEVYGYTCGLLVIAGKYEAEYRGVWAIVSGIKGLMILDTQIKVMGSNYCIYSLVTGGTYVDGCVLQSSGNGAGIGYGGWGLRGGMFVSNTIFYNLTMGISPIHNDAVITEHSNIYLLTSAATSKFLHRTAGTVAYSDYSCGWCLDGAPAAADRWGGKGLGEHSIEQDPLFVDAANGDFRLQSSLMFGSSSDSPCLNAGMPTLDEVT